MFEAATQLSLGVCRKPSYPGALPPKHVEKILRQFDLLYLYWHPLAIVDLVLCHTRKSKNLATQELPNHHIQAPS